LSLSYVSSLRNPLLKEYIKLQRSRRYRHKTKKIALEGPNLVSEAIQAGLTPQAVFFTQRYFDQAGKGWLTDLPPAVKQLVLPPALFNEIADTETPRPVAAIFYFSEADNNQEAKSLLKLVLILDRLRDPGNMGTIIRTAAAVGADIVYYTAGSVDPFSPKVLRATAGSIFHIKVKQAADPLVLIKELKKSGLQSVAASAKSAGNYWSLDFRQPTALIVGNEAGGVAEKLLAESDNTVSIPLCGRVESLNAAVASAVVLYEIIRQRSEQKPCR